MRKSKFSQTIDKICDIKKLKNYSMANKNFSVTYYQTPYDVFWPLGLQKT